ARIEKRLKAGEKYEFTQSNLVYRLKPKKERKCSILLMAHHDSKSQTFPTVFRVYFAFFLVFIFLLLASLYILCIALEFLGITQHIWLRPSTFGLGWINVGILLLLSFNRISNKSPGALDNASGLYTIWKIANDCTDMALENSEIWLILTGAEEIGQIGAAEFINEFREELNPESTYLINYEMMGLKNVPLKVLESYSFPRKRLVSPFLLPLIFESAKELQIPLKGWYLPIGANTDGLLFRKEGFKGIDFVTKEAGKYTHLSKDVANLINPMIIDDLVHLSVGIIKKLDKMF
ncbi:MAG: M28 family peptidase, partial [Promethearchaeota archaeon]